MNFKHFLLESEQVDVNKTLNKLPKSHRALTKGYKFTFQSGNTLKNDGDHIGFVDEDKKKICVASPWHYGREYTILHEVGHIVWKYLVDETKRKQWVKIVKNTKDEKQSQGAEEMFCMAYSNFYCKNQIVIHTHDTWEKFIRELPK